MQLTLQLNTAVEKSGVAILQFCNIAILQFYNFCNFAIQLIFVSLLPASHCMQMQPACQGESIAFYKLKFSLLFSTEGSSNPIPSHPLIAFGVTSFSKGPIKQLEVQEPWKVKTISSCNGFHFPISSPIDSFLKILIMFANFDNIDNF